MKKSLANHSVCTHDTRGGRAYAPPPTWCSRLLHRVASRKDDLLTHHTTFLPKNLSLHGEKASMHCLIATQQTAHAVTTGYGAETGLNRPKKSDTFSGGHDFSPVKRQQAQKCVRVVFIVLYMFIVCQRRTPSVRKVMARLPRVGWYPGVQVTPHIIPKSPNTLHISWRNALFVGTFRSFHRMSDTLPHSVSAPVVFRSLALCGMG
jgi:hypothetical protein